MNSYRTLLLLLISLLWLTGCGPYYRTFTFYDPPATAQGKNCIFHCEQKRDTCKNVCEEGYDDCYQDAKLQARHDYLNAKEDWLHQRERCISKPAPRGRDDKACYEDCAERSKARVKQAQHCKQRCKSKLKARVNGDRSAKVCREGCVNKFQSDRHDDAVCRQNCRNQRQTQVKKDDKGCHQQEPHKQDFMNTSHCRKSCGCEDNFQRCFQMCGGQIRHERRCMSNCE